LRRTRNQKGRKNSLQLLCPAVHKLEHLIELGGKEVQRGYNPPVWPQLVATLAEKEKKFDKSSEVIAVFVSFVLFFFDF